MLRATTVLASLAAFAAAQSSPCFERQYGTLLTMLDDSVSPPQTLPFSFPFHGGNVNVVTICSNGFLWLDGTTTLTDFSPTEAEFLTFAPRIAPLWVDINPALAVAGAGVWVNSFAPTATTAGRFVVTWDRCPYYGTSNTLTMQLQIDDTGSITFFYDANTYAHTSAGIAGVTQGNGATANIVDLSVTPNNSGTTPTFYEVFNDGTNGPLDLAGEGLLFLDNSNGGLLELPNACPIGAWVRYGSGCPKDGTVYESFGTGSCDLANTSMRFVNTGSGYITVNGGGFDPNYVNLVPGVGEDTIHQGLPIGFSFPFAGTMHTTVDLCSNGFLWLGSNASPDYSATLAEYLSLTPRIAPLWRDVSPQLGSGVFWDITPTYAMATWLGAPSYNVPNSPNDFQVKLYANGDIEFNYGQISPLGGSFGGATQTIVGFTEGNGAYDPGIVNYTFVVPGHTIGQSGRIPLVLDAVLGSTPRLGTTFMMELSNLPIGTAISVFAIGLNQQNVDASIFGLEGCRQYVSLDAIVVALPNGNSSTTSSLPIPNNSAFIGVQLFAQGLSLSPGFTSVGVISSNGGRILMGL
jgi:hypothetical protein